MEKLKLYMLLLGCKPPGRHTEQHDVFFHIGESLESLIPAIIASWPEAKGRIHVDAWRTVTRVGEFSVRVQPRPSAIPASPGGPRLYFINLGGYKKEVFEEFHYKLITVAGDKGAAIRQAKATAFYQHTGFEGATSHVDDKYGIDVDDAHEIVDIMPRALTEKYTIVVDRSAGIDRNPEVDRSAGAHRPADPPPQEDEMHLGYFQLTKLKGLG